MTKQSPRILITRLSHIGDCVLTMPMLSAIRDYFPSAFVAWAVEAPSNQLLANHPSLDEIIVIPKGWMGKPSQWGSVRKMLKCHQFDVAIDPQGITKSSILGWLSGAKQRIGIRGRWGRELSPWLNNDLVATKGAHLLDRSLELLVRIGIPKTEIRHRFEPDVKSVNFVDDFIEQNKLQRPFAVINPGASWPSKRWVTERFADVANHVMQRHGLRSVISWAGPLELDMAESIARGARAATLLAPKTSLQDLSALLQRAAFFIGCDTGPMHMATSVGTPCVGLYGPNRPEESGAYGTLNIHVQAWYQDGSCRERRNAENLAMRDISVKDVCCACDGMVKRIQRQTKAA